MNDDVQVDALMALVDTYAHTAVTNGERSQWAQMARGAVRVAVVHALVLPDAEPSKRKLLTDEEVRAEFAKQYPKDDAMLHLSENNRDYMLEAIGARHHLAAFRVGVRAAEAAHNIQGAA